MRGEMKWFHCHVALAPMPWMRRREVVCCAGVCLEDRDMEDEGMFWVKSVDEVVSVLLPQTPQKVRELLQLTFANPIKLLPTCFLKDFIHVSRCLVFSCKIKIWIKMKFAKY